MIQSEYMNAIIAYGEFEISDHSGVLRQEISAGSHTLSVEISYTITYTKDVYNRDGFVKAGEALDRDVDIDVTVVDKEGEEIELPYHSYLMLENQIDNQINAI